MMRDLWNALPDNRPITAVCVVEEPNKCPAGYQVVSRTYDQDTDADLWKDGFFGRKITRYLCISKTEMQYIVEDINVVNEKDPPPDGYTLLSHTSDTEQRAMRKRQFCYKLAHRDKATQAVTDIIVLSKSKKAPQGFTLAGELNSLLICYKTSPLSVGIPNAHTMTRSLTGNLPYSSSPSAAPAVGPSPPNNLPYPANPYAAPQQVGSLYPVNQLQQAGSQYMSTSAGGGTNPMSGEMTWPRPRRPPPPPPPSSNYSPSSASPVKSNTSTLSTSSLSNYGLDGIPFELNVRYKDMQTLKNFTLPCSLNKKPSDIEVEYAYDFSMERQAQQRLPLGMDY